MAEKKDPIRSLIDTGRRAGKLTSSEISDAMEENGNVLDVEAMEKQLRGGRGRLRGRPDCRRHHD